ncbi:MAG: polyol transport system substrate-binding protein [Solirubrobacteraceae bacterium]|jgi:sorbitol/mannitol transport system substrate-binding protein|nr:polyol transport system substrate-binding protein [Solirubrobacteraceae bacterium]MEA2395873.1 polyol transport system substrate-binding protein [Solirubrobacteraceae bacterium]
MRGTLRPWSAAALLAVVGAIAIGCGGGGSKSSSSSSSASSGTPASGTGKGGSINVAIVDNPQMKDIASLTPSLFTAKTGIKVNYTVLDEGTLREVTTRDVAAGGRQFDVAMIGPYEAPQFGKSGNLVDLTPQASADTAYNLGDLIPAVRSALSADGKLYAAPFYGESSFLMFRKDVLKKAGVTMPAHPTWDQVAAIARKVNTPQMAGICLRGKPGWGDLGASLTTVLNTFGATWWSAKPDGSVGTAQVNQPAFKQALQFYVNLIKDAGEKDAANASFNECLSQYKDGKVAMWYDATVAAGLLEAGDSPVKGKNGYVSAPVEKTPASGWLWSWALAIPKTSSKEDLAWKYISFATGPQYLKEAGSKVPGGWASIPPGTRKSTYEIPQYKKAAAAFAGPTLTSIAAAPINNPGTTKRPGLPGVQYVGIPEFQDVGNQCTQQFAAVIAGRAAIDAALKNCQDIASQAGQ